MATSLLLRTTPGPALQAVVAGESVQVQTLEGSPVVTLNLITLAVLTTLVELGEAVPHACRVCHEVDGHAIGCVVMLGEEEAR